MINYLSIFIKLSFVIFTISLNASEINYEYSSIADELLLKAKAVIRESEIQFKIKSPSKAIKEVRYAITILNGNGIDDSKLILPYTKYSSITDIQAVIYNEKGEKVKKIKKDEIYDYGIYSGYSIYDDYRVKYIDPEHLEYPFTIEYSYRISYNGILNYPDWEPIKYYGISIEKSTFSVITEKNKIFRYLENDLAPELNSFELEENRIYSWSIENYPAIIKEPFNPPLSQRTPVVYIAPSNFKISSVEGYTNTWDEFGNFIYNLNKDKLNLDEEAKSEILNQISSINDTVEIISHLYNYLQNNTRYVSIQIGIGAWEPFDAATVHKLKYGDCKALSNYMIALLDVVGIKSYYTLIKAGNNVEDILFNFPSNQFNHAIVCVPTKKDTIWLECTDQNMPFGYIGGFTDNRHALLINEKGGEIVKTSSYTMLDNVKTCNTDIFLNNEGSARIEVATKNQGLFYDKIRPILLEDQKDKEKRIYNKVHSPGAIIESFDYKESRGQAPSINESLKILISDYGTSVGNRMMVTLSPMSNKRNAPGIRDERKSEILIRSEFKEIDTVVIMIPENYLIYKLPEGENIESEFGAYVSQIKEIDNKIYFTRRIEINRGLFKQNKYDSFVEFYKEIVKADKSRAVLLLK